VFDVRTFLQAGEMAVKSWYRSIADNFSVGASADGRVSWACLSCQKRHRLDRFECWKSNPYRQAYHLSLRDLVQVR